MSEKGFIKLDRKLLEWGWKDNPNVVALWIEILLQANISDREWHGEKFEVGTFPTSLNRLSISTGLSVREVRTCLDKLKSTNEITIKTTNKGMKITVVKWADYQGTKAKSDKQPTSNRQTSDTQSTTLKEIKNERKKEYSIYAPTLDEVIAYCKERQNGVDANKFYNYYSVAGWKDSRGNPVKNWKQKMIANWEKEKPKADKPIVYDNTKNVKLTDNELNELLNLGKGQYVS